MSNAGHQNPQNDIDGREPADFNDWMGAGYKNAQLNYILYLVNYVLPFTAIVGLIFAYINRDKENVDNALYSHYQFQIWTFWLGLLYGLIGFLSVFILIGFLILPLLGVWWLVRSIRGLMAVSNKEPVTFIINRWIF